MPGTTLCFVMPVVLYAAGHEGGALPMNCTDINTGRAPHKDTQQELKKSKPFDTLDVMSPPAGAGIAAGMPLNEHLGIEHVLRRGVNHVILSMLTYLTTALFSPEPLVTVIACTGICSCFLLRGIHVGSNPRPRWR